MCCGSCLNCQRKAELAQHLGSEDGKMTGCLMMSVRSEADKTSCDKQLKQVSVCSLWHAALRVEDVEEPKPGKSLADGTN